MQYHLGHFNLIFNLSTTHNSKCDVFKRTKKEAEFQFKIINKAYCASYYFNELLQIEAHDKVERKTYLY